MNIDKLLNEINNYPNDIKNLIIKGLLMTSLTLRKSDNELLKNNTEHLSDGTNSHLKQNTGSLLENFLGGTVTQQTQQYAERYKAILEKADEFVVDMNGNIRKKDDLDKIKLFESRQNLGSQTTGYPFEMSFNNKKTLINDYEVGLGANPKYSYNVLINRNGEHNFKKLENVINNAIIRTIDDNNKIIELYCNNRAEDLEPEHLIKSNIIGFTLMKPSPRGFDTFYYKNNSYIGFEIVGGEIMFRFNCTFLNKMLLT